MSLRPSAPLPRRFRRPVSPRTRSLVERRYERRRVMRWERWKRLGRRFQQMALQYRRMLIRYSVAFSALALITFLGILVFSPLMRIREIRVIRQDARLDVERVQQVLSPLFHRHLLFLSAHEVRTALLNTVTDISGISISKDYPSALEVHIRLDPLIARLEIVDPDAADAPASGTGAFKDFLTSKGVVVSTTRVADADRLPVVRLVDWAVRPTNATHLLSVEFLESMQRAERALQEQFGQNVVARTVFLRAQEFHLTLPAYTLWFDIRSPLEDQLERYRVFLREIGAEQAKSYVDLRLSDRVIYR